MPYLLNNAETDYVQMILLQTLIIYANNFKLDVWPKAVDVLMQLPNALSIQEHKLTAVSLRVMMELNIVGILVQLHPWIIVSIEFVLTIKVQPLIKNVIVFLKDA